MAGRNVTNCRWRAASARRLVRTSLTCLPPYLSLSPPPPPASLSYYVSSLSLSLTMCPLSGAYLRQPAVPSGKIGKLRIHQSGKVTMLIGDIECVSSLTALCLCAPCSVSLCPPPLC